MRISFTIYFFNCGFLVGILKEDCWHINYNLYLNSIHPLHNIISFVCRVSYIVIYIVVGKEGEPGMRLQHYHNNNISICKVVRQLSKHVGS